MNRRNFLSNAASVAVASSLAHLSSPINFAQTSDLIFPERLRAGDTVGVITPATAVPDPDRLALVERTVRYFGLRLKMARNAGRRMSDYRASVTERLDDLHSMFRDREVKAVFALRGGYGSGHLLDGIDYDLIRRNPKIFLGYSDITAMHLAIHKQTRLVTFHGPMLLARFTDYTQQHFRRALFEPAPLGRLTNPPESNELRPGYPLRSVVRGRARGKLIGGNLTLICQTLGTPYEIETRGRILFLEDVGEEPYSIDRMLTQLRLAGKLQAAAGIVWGVCQDCAPREFQPSSVIPYSLGEIIDNILGSLRVPVLSGMTIGHTNDQLTLPLGVEAVLDADAGTLEITEAGVR
jgi:muramoyltetrapeptide carboxypeptidase